MSDTLKNGGIQVVLSAIRRIVLCPDESGWEAITCVNLVDQSAEIRISMDTPPPTRDEFWDICDGYETAEEIISALQSL